MSHVLPFITTVGLGLMCVAPEWRVSECASPLLFCHQTLQMFPPLPQLLTQDLMPSHLRPQLI